MRLSVGARVGNYTLKYRLGQGGMAEVWAATHRVLSVDVALKVLFNTNPTLQNRLLQEGRAQAAMDHPNILPVRDVVDVDGAMGLVLPLIRGPSLDKLLQGYHPTRDEAVFLFQAIVEGVRHAHERGLIHRDLKPGNVLLEERNSHIVPRIADFGLVKNSAAPTQTRAHAVMGTLNYAAPEQFLDASSVDHRADLFSLGVIFTELLTGKCPFQGASVRGLLAAYEAGPNLSGVPQAFTGLCQALLAHEVNRRPADCTAVLDALHSAHPTGRASMLGLSSAVAKASRSRDAADVDETIPIRSDVAPDASAGSDDALTDAFPVRASPPRHNLPAEVDAFIGRSDALSVLSESLHSSRLVSILGIGGTGKTRLAVHFARHHISDYPGGVFFCDLSDARTLEGLLFVVAQVMDVPLSEGDPLKKLGHAIAGHGQCLMIFDNFEQLAAHAAETVGAWLKRAEAARFVVTSRALLEIHGEHPLRLAPLKDEEAVALFVERSAVKKRGFVLDDTNRDAIHQLVRLLDGLPLAIELATARIKLMTPQTMLSRMNHRFQLLSVGRRAVGRRAVGRPDTVKRQATLRATIDWSWNLLEDWEQSAFIQCSVFEGGFTLEAAEAVIDLSTIDDAPWAMDAVQSLVDKSLLVPLGENPLGKVRFGMLMSLHDYAHEKLNRLDAVESDTIRRRHLTVYEAFGRPEALAGLKRRDGGAQWWALLEEIDNLTAANRFAITIGAIEAAALTAMALYAIAERKQPALAIAALSNVLDLNPHQGEPHALPGLHSALGVLYFEQGQTERATRCYAQALARSRESGDRLHESEVLVCLGRLCQSQGNTVQAELHYQRALALLDEVGDPRREMMVLNPLGVLRNTQGRIQDADQCYQRALTIARTIHDRRTEGTVLANWGNLRMHQGQLEEASRFYRQALAIHREVGSRNRESMTLSNLGILHWHLGQMKAAGQFYRQALAIHREVGDRRGEGMVLTNLGSLLIHQGNVSESRQHYQRALVIHREVENRTSEANVLYGLGRLYLKQGQIEEAERHFRQALAIHRSGENRSGEGVLLASLGAVYQQQSDTEAAEQHFQRALSISRESGNRLTEGNILLLLGTVQAERGEAEASERSYQQALSIHRDLGSRSGEGDALRHLGAHHAAHGRTKEAEQHYQQALIIFREVGAPHLEGAVLGHLGLLLAKQGQHHSAHEHIQWGERLLREPHHRMVLVELLCQRAQLEHLAGTPEAARDTFAEIEREVQTLHVQSNSSLAKALAETRTLLNQSRARSGP